MPEAYIPSWSWCIWLDCCSRVSR